MTPITNPPRAAWYAAVLRFLGSRLGLAFVGVVVVLALFGKLTEDVIHAEAVTRFDHLVHQWVRLHATGFGYGFFGVITTLGSPPVLAFLGSIGLAVFLAQRRQLVAMAWTGIFLGGALLDAALKVLVHRPRPDTASDFLARSSWSYPSGHSMMSLVAFGMIAWALVRLRFHDTWARGLVVLGAAGMTFLVGLSRIYLGVHYFSDVLAGFLSGAIWLTAGIAVMEAMQRSPSLPPPNAGTPPPP